MYLPTDHNALSISDEEESGFLALAHSSIAGGASGVFDKFLGAYVLLERQNLTDMLARLSQVCVYICVCVCIDVYMRVYRCVIVCVYIYVYIYMCIYM